MDCLYSSAAAFQIISSKSFPLELGLHWNILNTCRTLQSASAWQRCAGSRLLMSGRNCNQGCAIYRLRHRSQDKRIWPRSAVVSCEIRLCLSSSQKVLLMGHSWNGHKINPLSQPLLLLVTSIFSRWRPVQSLRMCVLWILIWRRVKIKA